MAIAAVLTTTIENSRRKLVKTAVKSNALMAWAFATKRVETEDGGYNITNPIQFGRNSNVAAYQYYDSLPVGQTNEFAKAEYTWSRVAGTMIISDQEQDENRGDVAVTKLITAKLDALEESIKDKFSEYLYGAGAGIDPLGLAALIPDDPTTGTLGTLSRATNTWWRTSSYNFAGGLNGTNIEEAFSDIAKLDLKLKDERPDLMLCGRNIIRHYNNAAKDKMTIPMPTGSSGNTMIDLGFDASSFGGITMMYDEDCPVNKCYFINSKFLKLHMLKGVNMKVKELVAPWTVDAIGKRIVWQGQFCLWDAFRRHAVLNN